MQSVSPHSPMMNWLPLAGDFREDLRAAMGRAKPADALEGLAVLAGHCLSFLETVQLDRGLARLDVKEASGVRPDSARHPRFLDRRSSAARDPGRRPEAQIADRSP
jgi:hypothetical protein